MDYTRVYRDFIEDRLANPRQGKTERHHILPRSLGGTDKPINLMRLTPSDHYFAHLCLAKIHGGKQWGGVHCMAKMVIPATEQRSVFASRYMVGVARAKFAENQSKRMTGNRRVERDKVGVLFNVDGRTVRGSRTQLAELTGVSLASVSRLLNGKQGLAANGWYHSELAKSQADLVRRESGRRSAANVAGANRRPVTRLDCGTTYESLQAASAAWATNTSNIARAIRLGQRAAASGWAYR